MAGLIAPLFRPTFIVFVALCSITGCDSDDNGTPQVASLGGTRAVFADSAGVATVTHPGSAVRDAPLLQLSQAPAIRIGVTTGPDEFQFSSISDARRLSDGSFVVVDRRVPVARLFDSLGSFVRQIGRVGEGPGEYTLPTKVIAGPGETFGVWDFRRRTLSTFRLDGSLVGSERLDGSDPIAPAFQPNGDLLALWHDPTLPAGLTGHGSRYLSSAVMIRHLLAGTADTLARFDAWDMQISEALSESGVLLRMVGPPGSFGRRLLAAATSDGIWTSDGSTWTIEHRAATDGTVDRVVWLNLPLEPFPDSVVDAAPASDYPETLPPIREILADASDRLWIGVLSLPVEELPGGMGSAIEEWIVVSATGEEIVGRVVFPPSSRPMYADREGVLILRVGELDVPRLEWWTFTS